MCRAHTYAHAKTCFKHCVHVIPLRFSGTFATRLTVQFQNVWIYYRSRHGFHNAQTPPDCIKHLVYRHEYTYTCRSERTDVYYLLL